MTQDTHPAVPERLPGITIITGTDTDVGKTVATASLAAWLLAHGTDLVVCKPAQTGMTPGEPGDLAQVGRLTGLGEDRLVEFVRLPEPLAPTTAARRAGRHLPSMREVARLLVGLAEQHEAVLVEGAGGILVGLDEHGAGLLELADALTALGHRPRFVVVARSGLGTLNHTGLTAQAITRAGHELLGQVVGSWPEEPDLATLCNVQDLAGITPVLAVLPEGIGEDPQAAAAAVRAHSPATFRPAPPFRAATTAGA